MKEANLHDKIFKDFPELFGLRNNPKVLTGICFGIETPTTWLPHIYELCKEVSEISKKKNLDIEVSQIKEKYGGLRFYYSGWDDEIDHLIDYYDNKCSHTCERCGKKGKSIGVDGWIHNLCSPCLKEHYPHYEPKEVSFYQLQNRISKNLKGYVWKYRWFLVKRAVNKFIQMVYKDEAINSSVDRITALKANWESIKRLVGKK